MRRLYGIEAAEVDGAALAERLRNSIKGDVRFDRLARALYSTDASIYEILPLGVVMPRSASDVAAAVNVCRGAGVPMIARGAGTGLTGGAVGPGVQLDLSRHMTRIGPFDPSGRTVIVEPGVVLDELNAALVGRRLHFAPDVATSSRATIGGMIANNSCGAHSIVYGRTVDHVQELTVVLADGQTVTFGANDVSGGGPSQGRRMQIASRLGEIRDRYYDEIQKRFPKVMRSNGGYGLDRLGPPGAPPDVTKVLCGSEGTLGVIVSATLRLVPLPKAKGLAVLHFRGIREALGVTPTMLRHQPAAVELIDRLIIEAARANPAIGDRVGFLSGTPEAIVVVEFFGETQREVAERIEGLIHDPDVEAAAYAAAVVVHPLEQSAVWNLRTAGLGLLMSKPGDAQPYSFVEDTAVDPARLGEYISRFSRILDREGVHAGYYAHASVGCIHVKPVLNLKNAQGVEQMRRIADAVSDLALEFGGAFTGEHGDGMVRSCWLEKTYGPRIMSAFREIKELFDPDRLMNPHKIVDPWAMTDHLRYGPAFRSAEPKTLLSFDEHGGIAGLAGMCSGVGQCRQKLVGVMCPSYVATGDETHTTRARANALRMALSNRGLLMGLDDPALAEVMDLCVSCKACKTECPTGVDMARIKAEYLAHRNLVQGASRRARFLADLPHKLAWASRLPRLASAVARSATVRWWLERKLGLDSRVASPRLATRTFRRWFARRRGVRPVVASHGQVIYFVDTWTNYFTPQVGVAAVRMLERMGYEVLCPETVCCGRPAISQGLLLEAKNCAEHNIRKLGSAVARGVPVLGTEPSCLSAFLDEYPRLVRSPLSDLVASRSMMFDTFLRREIEKDSATCQFSRARALEHPVLYHGHCHQKALVGTADAMALLRAAFGESVIEINGGCCGMAGSFGHEKEHYEVAAAMGEHRLFPAIRERPGATVAVSGFSCREQIHHHTAVEPRHVVELLVAVLEARDQGLHRPH